MRAHRRDFKDDGNQADLRGGKAIAPPSLKTSFHKDSKVTFLLASETFFSQPPLTVFKGGENSPVIPKEALPKSSTILKAAKMNLTVGSRKHFKITAPTTTNEGLYSIAVKDGVQEGTFPLNKTNLEVLCDRLGMDSDQWIDAEFDGLVVPTKNAKDQTPTLGWFIIRESVKAPSKSATAA